MNSKLKTQNSKLNSSLVTAFRLDPCPLTLTPNKKGFTLVELAIVLIIIGLLAGMGAGFVAMLTKRAKLAETRETVKTAYESILGYAASNKKLPTDLNALGIKTKDSYSADLRYYRVSSFVSNNLCTSTGTYLSVTDKGTAKNNVSFIIFSDGGNKCNQTGTSTFTIYETDAVVACPQDTNAGYDDTVMYVDINKLREIVCTSFKVVTETLPTGTEETGYPSATLEATDGTTPYTWTITSGSLPSGLSLSSDGKITGVPIADGSYNFTVKVEDSDSPKKREATKGLTITINPNDPRITTEFLHYGTKGSSYTASLGATGGAGSYAWGLSSGPLPPGLTLSGSTISGNPTTAGTYSFTIQITDSRGRTAQKTLSIAVN